MRLSSRLVKALLKCAWKVNNRPNIQSFGITNNSTCVTDTHLALWIGTPPAVNGIGYLCTDLATVEAACKGSSVVDLSPVNKECADTYPNLSRVIPDVNEDFTEFAYISAELLLKIANVAKANGSTRVGFALRKEPRKYENVAIPIIIPVQNTVTDTPISGVVMPMPPPPNANQFTGPKA